MAWRQLTPAEAKAHPAYGVKGWMLFFALLSLFGAIYGLASVIGSFSGMIPFQEWSLVAQVFFVLAAVLQLALSIAIFAKSPLARTLVLLVLIQYFASIIAILAGAYDTVALVSPELRDVYASMRSPERQALFQVPALLVWFAILWYFFTRQRPNVTLMHRDKDLAA